MALPFAPESKGKYAAKGSGMGICYPPNLHTIRLNIKENTFKSVSSIKIRFHDKIGGRIIGIDFIIYFL